MAISIEQLKKYHEEKLHQAVEKTAQKPTSRVEEMVWNAYYTELEFHAQAVALIGQLKLNQEVL